MAVKLTVEISEELRERAEATAALQGRTLADVVRSVLEKYVEKTTTAKSFLLIETDPIFRMAGTCSGASENIGYS